MLQEPGPVLLAVGSLVCVLLGQVRSWLAHGWHLLQAAVRPSVPVLGTVPLRPQCII